jgi:Holliday junction DNA helicase RuvA
MIGRLSGRLAYAAADQVMIDVGGVGYVVHVSDRTRMALPPVGEAVSLWTDLLVREDLLQLMGFTSLVEKEWYRLLTTVQGVGAKSALGIVGALGPDGVSRAIALGDWASIKAAPGVGPKIAQRVVNELKDKAPGVMAMGASAPAVQAGPAASGVVVEPVPVAPPGGASPAQAEAMSALGNLGYAPAEAARAVAEALDEAPGADTAALIRASLKRLAPKG